MTQINFKCSEDEKKIISTKAKELGLSTSAYIKFIALNCKVKVTSSKNTVNGVL